MENASTGTDKDSLDKASSYFEEVRFLPFSDKREEYQRQHVAIKWRDSFVAKFESKCDTEHALRDSDLPAELDDFVKSTGAADTTDAGILQVNALYLVSTYKDNASSGGSAKEGESTMARAKANLQKLELEEEEKLKEMKGSGSTSPTSHLLMVALLCATNGIDLSDSSTMKLVGEFLKEQLVVESGLWLLDKYNDKFKAIPELEELSGTPFMVQVVTEILPMLKVEGSSSSEKKSALIVLFGDTIGDEIWALLKNKYSKEVEDLVALPEHKDKIDKINELALVISAEILGKVEEGKIKLDASSRLNDCFLDNSDRFLSRLQRGVQVVLSRKPTRRNTLYDYFTSLYLMRGSRKALISRHGSYTYNTIMNESLAYCTNLALFMTKHGKTKLMKGTRSVFFSEKRPIDVFFEDEELLIHARNAAPVTYSGSFLSFNHKVRVR